MSRKKLSIPSKLTPPRKFKIKIKILPNGSSCVLPKLMDNLPLLMSFLLSNALAIILCFFNFTGLLEGFLHILKRKNYYKRNEL